MPRELAFVDWEEGDWFSLYEDGKLISDGHSITGRDMLDTLGISYEHIEIPADDDAVDFCVIRTLDELKSKLAEKEAR